MAAGTGFRGTQIPGSVSPVGAGLLVGAFLFAWECRSRFPRLGLGGWCLARALLDHAAVWTGPKFSFAETPLGYPSAVLIALTLMSLVVFATASSAASVSPGPRGAVSSPAWICSGGCVPSTTR